MCNMILIKKNFFDLLLSLFFNKKKKKNYEYTWAVRNEGRPKTSSSKMNRMKM